MMKSWDVIIIGGGIIGLSLGRELRKHDRSVLILERGQPGQEASYAAAGMLAHCDPHTPVALQPLAAASAQLYSEFVHELEDESGQQVDLRREGAIILSPDKPSLCPNHKTLDPTALHELEPALECKGRAAEWWPEASVDPRALSAAALKAAKHRNVDVSSGQAVQELLVEDKRVSGVRTGKSTFLAPVVVNCAGAWAGQIAPYDELTPTRPVKGQLLAVVPKQKNLLRHVVRAPQAYLVPRSDGRILIGVTVEESGFDKRTLPETIQRLYHGAIELLPALKEARILEDWAGLRPGTPDDLPILGGTSLPGYFVATGHYRDGILLCAVTARIMADLICDQLPAFDLSPFSPMRFSHAAQRA